MVKGELKMKNTDEYFQEINHMRVGTSLCYDFSIRVIRESFCYILEVNGRALTYGRANYISHCVKVLIDTLEMLVSVNYKGDR